MSLRAVQSAHRLDWCPFEEVSLPFAVNVDCAHTTGQVWAAVDEFELVQVPGVLAQKHDYLTVGLVLVNHHLHLHAQLVLGSKHFVELSLLAVFVVEKPLGSLVLDTVTGESVDDQVVFLWALLPSSDQFPEDLHVELLGL